jgi:hypothetical protein
VAQVTKQGFVFVFRRSDGEPIWPIVEVPVPQSTVPGEKTAPTQPIPTQPPPFERQGVAIDELVDFTPQLRAAAIAQIAQYDWGELFTPPSTRGAILMPGIGGGGNWGGASFDPDTGTLYVTSLGSLPYLVELRNGGAPNFYFAAPSILLGPLGQFYLFKPPYATITAYDLNRGEILWRVPNGAGGGVVGHASSLLTKTLLFYKTRSRAKLTVFDKANGQLLREIGLPANASGAPMTYMTNGRQYLVVAVGVEDQTMELVALALPGALESAGAVHFAESEIATVEGAGEARFAVVRAGGSRGAVTVDVVPSAGSAAAGQDFVAATNTLSWADGETATKQGSVAIVDDALEEAAETFVLELANPSGELGLAAPSRATVTLENDDVEPCAVDDVTLCLRGQRFRVRTTFRTAAQQTGVGRAFGITGDSGFFTFFGDGNVEVLVKVLDACAPPFDRFWVFAAGLTDVEVTLTVTDTAIGAVRSYRSELGQAFAPIQDTTAFATCP